MSEDANGLEPTSPSVDTTGVDEPIPVAARRPGLEAVLFLTDEPIEVALLAELVDATPVEVEHELEELVRGYEAAGSGIELRRAAGGWRLYSAPAAAPVVRRFALLGRTGRLTQAALETLAVIAYKQPISRGAVASIRAVNVDSVVRTLLGRGLITEAFTDSETGAINYATTDLLLAQLGINSLDELPYLSPLLNDGANGFEELP